jgi:hypothetical protein
VRYFAWPRWRRWGNPKRVRDGGERVDASGEEVVPGKGVTFSALGNGAEVCPSPCRPRVSGRVCGAHGMQLIYALWVYLPVAAFLYGVLLGILDDID